MFARARCAGNLNFGLIDDAGGRITGAVEFINTGFEVFIADIGSAGDEAAHVDFRAGAEKYAVTVDDPDLAVGIELAFDPRQVAADVAVQRNGAG